MINIEPTIKIIGTTLIVSVLLYCNLVALFAPKFSNNITPLNPNPQHSIKVRVEINNNLEPLELVGFLGDYTTNNCHYYADPVQCFFANTYSVPWINFNMTNYKQIDNNT